MVNVSAELVAYVAYIRKKRLQLDLIIISREYDIIKIQEISLRETHFFFSHKEKKPESK
jgi:hypothetical protein